MMDDHHDAESRRVADYLGVPVHGQWTDPDPIVVDLIDGMHTMGIVQLYTFQLTCLGVLAEVRGNGFQFAMEVSFLIWTS